MFTLDEIMNMSQEEFTQNWKNNKIQDSALKLLDAREMTDEDKKEITKKINKGGA